MNGIGWLKQSLLDARAEMDRMPAWKRELMAAREALLRPK